MEAPWSYLLYFYGVLVDALSMCEAPMKLNATELNRDQDTVMTPEGLEVIQKQMGQINGEKLHHRGKAILTYLGRWFFIAAAASSTSSLATFTTTDNAVFSMTQSNSPERLQLRAAIQLKTGECVPRSWIYLLKEQSADLATEGRPYMRTELFAAKCHDSIIVQERDQNYHRILLYSRVLHPAENCIAEFKDKAFCLDMDEFLLIPRTQNTCEFQET